MLVIRVYLIINSDVISFELIEPRVLWQLIVLYK